MENFKTLKLKTVEEFILTITLHRPDRFNAINSEMMLELRDCWQQLYIDTKKWRCVILTGTEPAFCAGADLKERHGLQLDTWRKQKATFEQAILAMIDCPLPVIAAVNGAAFGGGLEMILASDFAYASDNATFAQSEVKLGLIPGALGTQHLPRACGLRRAKELTFTGNAFSAQEAYDWGIINKVVPLDNLENEVLQIARQICNNAPLAVRQVKKSLNMSQQVDIKSGYNFELEAYYRLLNTQDCQEGIKAFNEKRKAEFTGK